jgi:hypothetical protein
MATITSTGTWTPLNVDFTKSPKTGPNVPAIASMQLEQIKPGPPSQSPLLGYPELVQFLQLMADGYGISYNAAKALFSAIWTAEMNKEDPLVTGGTQRLFIGAGA